MEKAYNGLMGGYKVIQDGDEKHTCTHVVLTVDEYNNLIQEKKNLKSQLSSEKQAHADDVAEVKTQAKRQVNSIQKDAQDKINQYSEHAKTCKDEMEQAKALNINLKRICRENANAKRGLKPKRQHSGFIVVQTGEARERVKSGRNISEDRVYKSVIETPYNELMSLSQVKDASWDDGLKDFFDSAWQDTDSTNYVDAVSDKNAAKNFMYKQDWRTGKNGLWEVVCWHTKPIDLTA